MMRRPRAIIFDDEVVVLEVLKAFLSKRNYEVISFPEPRICPLYEQYTNTCSEMAPCADILITDFKMPQMNGAELLSRQSQRGCRLDSRNKAVMSGHLDEEQQKGIETLGSAQFAKPLNLSELSAWLSEREKTYDLSEPLAVIEKRNQGRYPYHGMVEYYLDGTESEVSHSLGINISESGMCLYVWRDLCTAQVITIKSRLPVDPRRGTIRWIKNLHGTFSIAGLMFT
jgi:CheY-like chemotaxis protein